MRWVGYLVVLSAIACTGTSEIVLENVLGTVVTLQRTLCFGTCPAYSVRIEGDGAVTYQGDHFVRVHGAASRQVAVSETQRLVTELEQARYWQLSVPDTCALGSISDQPTATTSMTRGAMSHTVSHDQGNPCAPAVLKTLETRIDEVAGTSEWVDCDTPGGFCPDP